MSSSTFRERRRIAPLILCLAIAAVFAAFVAPAKAGQYKLLLCAGNVGSNGFATSSNVGFISVHNFCGPAPDPAGNSAFLRIEENSPGGAAPQGAFANIIFDVPPFVHFKTAGGFTREPASFNEGWRARLWGHNFETGNSFQSLTQGLGLPNTGTEWGRTDTFAPHVWPFGFQFDFHRFVFEMQCVRPGGCDRSGVNIADVNTLVFIMNDDINSLAELTNRGAPLFGGAWVRGVQTATWQSSDLGSGLRFERLFIDNAVIHVIDHAAAGACNLGFSGLNGEFARVYQPCPTGGPFARSLNLNTEHLSDGPHPLSVCSQDYGQAVGLSGTGSQSCASATIRTDNTPPGAPPGLQVTSPNAARYLDHFDAHWNLPPNQGSPIAKIHYEIINAKGEVVVPEKVVTGTDLSQLSGIVGPSKAGEYRLRLWLEDTVGFAGAPSTAPIPHDTTPPAAPQEVSVTPPSTSRQANGFDLRWRNLPDPGSAIEAAHYQVLDRDRQVVVPTRTVSGNSVQSIGNLEAPNGRGEYSLRLWLSDAEGNVGAPATVPLAYECQRSEVATGTALSSGLGKEEKDEEIVQQGEGSLLKGKLTGAGGAGVAGASLCVFSRVVTDKGRDFLGLAVSGSDGRFQFAVPPGASRDLSVDYRSGHRELTSTATLETVVHPTFRVKKKVVYNKHAATFSGEIPGPNNDRVVIVLQAKRGDGWVAYRRYRTRANGKFSVSYRFFRTDIRTRYFTRAQVRQTVGYPYLQGNSKPLSLLVLPKRRG